MNCEQAITDNLILHVGAAEDDSFQYETISYVLQFDARIYYILKIIFIVTLNEIHLFNVPILFVHIDKLFIIIT